METKTEIRHTPGPWHTGNGSCHKIFALKQNGRERLIGTVATQNGNEDYDSAESFANARLFAAAPDLLDALEAALVVIEREGFWVFNNGQIEAAIAKARGQA